MKPERERPFRPPFPEVADYLSVILSISLLLKSGRVIRILPVG